MELEKRIIQTDVLVVGGGLAGCMAAIRASELVGGENVLVVEKGNVRRSGNAATGIDHTWSYMPEVHDPQGFTPELLVEDHINKLGPLQDQDLIHTIASTIADRIKEMEGWGFPFKTEGKYRYVQKIHRVPSFLHWAGRDQKVLFSKELKKRGIEVFNRVLGTEILKENGRVNGVLGVDTRKPLLYIFQAKAVIVTTGGISRIYPSITSMDFGRQRYPYGTGDGIAMSYRAGAEVTRLEFNTRWSGTKSYVKPGRGTWIGVMEDVNGDPLTGVKTKADRGKVDMAVESPADMIRSYKEGRGPIYMNCTEISDEDFAYMNWGLSNEGNLLMLQHMKEAGINPQDNRVEFTFYEPELTGGLVINPKGETNVKGLFAAGGEVIGNIKRAVSPGSYAIGWISGETAGKYSKEQEIGDLNNSSDFIREKLGLYSEILRRREGASWKEACGACQDIMGYYAGETRYETLLNAGLKNIRKIRERAVNTLSANNSHELVHCLEALNLIDIGEASIISSLERKETRINKYDPFVRVDYPEENAKMSRFLILKMENGKPLFQWREPRKIF